MTKASEKKEFDFEAASVGGEGPNVWVSKEEKIRLIDTGEPFEIVGVENRESSFGPRVDFILSDTMTDEEGQTHNLRLSFSQGNPSRDRLAAALASHFADGGAPWKAKLIEGTTKVGRTIREVVPAE